MAGRAGGSRVSPVWVEQAFSGGAVAGPAGDWGPGRSLVRVLAVLLGLAGWAARSSAPVEGRQGPEGRWLALAGCLPVATLCDRRVGCGLGERGSEVGAGEAAPVGALAVLG